MEPEWRAARIFHLSCGVRAFNLEGALVDLEPGTTSGKAYQFQSKSYRTTYGELQRLGFAVVGVDHYTHRSEIEGIVPPNWRVFRQGWPAWEQGQAWAELANAGFQTKEGLLWDLSSRISHQFRICSWRVRQASEAYAGQLRGQCKQKKIENGQRFEDGFTRLAYGAIQSYLIDACTLRDYLAEFLGTYVWPQNSNGVPIHVTAHSGLMNKILPNVPRPDPLAEVVQAASAAGGWLEVLGHYRDLVVHTAPLASAGGRLLAVIEYHPLPDNQVLPVLRLPLPTNPAELRAQRAKRALFGDFQAQLDAFVQSATGQTPSIDGLNYVWDVHGRLADFGALVLERSPVKGQMLTLDDSDLRGDIRLQP